MEKVSGVFTTDKKASRRRVHLDGIKTGDLDRRVDNATFIDSTKVYGKDKELTKTEVDKFNRYDLSAEKGVVSKIPHTLVSYNQDNFPNLDQKWTITQNDITQDSGTKFKDGDRKQQHNRYSFARITGQN